MRVPERYRRNERSPSKGIETIHRVYGFIQWCGVEMKEARVRALKHNLHQCRIAVYYNVEMKEARVRALKRLSHDFAIMSNSVEMKEARVRALKQSHHNLTQGFLHSRNERSPSKGIETRRMFRYVLLL